MNERPPVVSLTRGLVFAALGSGLAQIVVISYYGITIFNNGDADEVLKLNVVIPVIFFGACVGFTCGYPNGRHSPGWTADYLLLCFASSISVFSQLILGPLRQRNALPNGLTCSDFVVYLLTAVMMCSAIILLISYRIRRLVAEQAARQRCGIEECPVEESD